MSWSLDIIQEEYIIMIIHDKLGKQAGKVVDFGLASSCDVTVRQDSGSASIDNFSAQNTFINWM